MISINTVLVSAVVEHIVLPSPEDQNKGVVITCFMQRDRHTKQLVVIVPAELVTAEIREIRKGNTIVAEGVINVAADELVLIDAKVQRFARGSR